MVVTILLLAVLMQSVAPLKVFEFQTDIWRRPTLSSYARFDIRPKGEDGDQLKDYSLCYRFQNKVLSELETHWSFATQRDNNEILIGREGLLPVAVVQGHDYQGWAKVHVRPSLHKWDHWCVTVDTSVTLFINGEKMVSSDREATMKPLLLNGTLIFGQEQDSVGGGFIINEIFRGYLTQMNLWSRVLSSEDIFDMANCVKHLDGDVFSSENDEATLVDSTILDQSLASFCIQEINMFAIPKSLNFYDAIKMCHRFGSNIFGPKTLEQNLELRNLTEIFGTSCPGSFWVGVSDEITEGIWKGVADDKVVVTYFDSPPSGGDNRECAVVIASSGNWLNEHCTKGSPRCLACQATHKGAISMKGLCFSSMQKSLLDLRGYINNLPYFQGFFGLILYMGSLNNWILYDSVENITIAECTSTHGKTFPIGRSSWKLNRSMCGHRKDSVIKLGMSACKVDDFMCSDGECILGKLRCNSFADCADQTDEENCNIVEPPSGYLKHIPPINFIEKSEPLPLNVTFSIDRFVNILDYKHTVDVELKVEIMWQDSRLAFNNLKDNDNQNNLKQEEIDLIWKPNYHFTNIQDGALRVIGRNMKVKKISDPSTKDINSVTMNIQYGGTGAILSDTRVYTGSFSCRFDVFLYPLDQQVCTIELAMGIGNPTEIEVIYNRETLLQQFEVSNFTTYFENETKIIKVFFKFRRLPNFIMFAMLLPTIMLQIIGYSTLFLKPEQLQVRLTISLTTLLVLYTLFSQTSSELPKTSYIKMVDIWFFFCISVLFFIIVLHVVIERIGRMDEDRVQSLGKKGWTPNMIPYESKTNWSIFSIFRRMFLVVPSKAPEKVLFVARMFIVPLVVIPFTLVFWLKISKP